MLAEELNKTKTTKKNNFEKQYAEAYPKITIN